MTAITAWLLPQVYARAEPLQITPKIGEEHQIVRSYESSGRNSDGSLASSSSGRDTILERVIAVRATGLELEYDLPKEATTQDRARSWQFPARVFKSSSGSTQLLNRGELELRLESWLKAARWTRKVCGRWIFTWNAFHIDCDPQSVITTIEAFDLRPADLRAGAMYQEAESRGGAPLTRRSAALGGSPYDVVIDVDSDAVRRARAESDVVVGELSQQPVTLEAALRERAKEAVSGTIFVTFETDAAGDVRRRVKVTKLVTKEPDGRSKTETTTETVERHLVSGPSTDR